MVTRSVTNPLQAWGGGGGGWGGIQHFSMADPGSNTCSSFFCIKSLLTKKLYMGAVSADIQCTLYFNCWNSNLFQSCVTYIKYNLYMPQILFAVVFSTTRPWDADVCQGSDWIQPELGHSGQESRLHWGWAWLPWDGLLQNQNRTQKHCQGERESNVIDKIHG